MMPPLLHARGIAIGYRHGDGDERTILQGFGLELAVGEVVALLGASGVGKSSLLRVLAGLQAPRSGTLRFLDQPLTAPHPRIAVAFQAPGLLPWLSVERNAAFGLDFKHQPALSPAQRARRVEQALREVGLTQARHAFPGALSGGMAQRVALARCFARQPSLLLLDEPFGALDALTREHMQQLLKRLIEQHQTAVVLVTHDIDEALLLADRVVLLGGAAPASVVGEWPIALDAPRSAQIEQLGYLRIEILKRMHAALGAAPPLASTH